MVTEDSQPDVMQRCCVARSGHAYTSRWPLNYVGDMGWVSAIHADRPKAKSPRIPVLPQQAEPKPGTLSDSKKASTHTGSSSNTRVRFAQFRYHQIVLVHNKLHQNHASLK